MSDTPPSANHEGEAVVHEVDGIQELDNKLPNWWLATFYVAILFGIGYYFYYDIFDGEPQARVYRREMAQRMEAQGKSVPITAALLEDMSHDSAAMGEAASLFAKTCASCHGGNGGGAVGPNLTDDYWLHGGGAERIFASINDGYPAKGMPAWGAQLGQAKIAPLAAYVLSMRGKNVVGGKAPQGEKEAP